MGNLLRQKVNVPESTASSAVASNEATNRVCDFNHLNTFSAGEHDTNYVDLLYIVPMGDSMSVININNEHPASNDTSHANFGAKLIAQTINTVHIINNPPCPPDDHDRLSRPLGEDSKQSYHQFGKHLWSRFLDAKWKKSLAITISFIALSTIVIFPILNSKNVLPYQKTQSVHHTSSTFFSNSLLLK